MHKVLIVDDDRTTTKLLQMLLEMEGFEVQVSPRGGDVVPMAVKFMPDIFLMDYHLSDMDGVEVIRDLRAGAADGKFTATPIVVASGLNVEDEVLAAGANAFLVKPFQPDELPPLMIRLIGAS
ncbi:MAG: response regulator transcription factor [Armatimonadetes bacterium]|nr:response regulator transcription factor [Anaerolineae bacterium]